MTKFGILVLIVAALGACQSGGGSSSLNAGYAGTGNCYYSYDYSNTGTSSCLGRMWH
jgi:hypothetical protein